MIHLYAFAHGLRSLPAERGVGGELLDREDLGGVDAVVGELHEAVAADAESAVAHGRVVEALVPCADAVLPVRFGRPFASREALREAAAPQLAGIRERLLRVRGCVEVAVRFAEDGREPLRRDDGASYLRELARRNAAAEAIHAALEERAVAGRLEHTGRLFRAAYLVRRPEVEAFARHVDRVAETHGDATLVCTGPWAPYSFAEERA